MKVITDGNGDTFVVDMSDVSNIVIPSFRLDSGCAIDSKGKASFKTIVKLHMKTTEPVDMYFYTRYISTPHPEYLKTKKISPEMRKDINLRNEYLQSEKDKIIALFDE